MAKEYIDREVVKNAITADGYEHFSGCLSSSEIRLLELMLDSVSEIPAEDVTEVVHGKWIRPHWKNNNYCCDCSECSGEAMHRDYQWDKHGIYPICPNCGAKMDGGE